MHIPSQFLPINTNRPKPAKRNQVSLEKTESESDSAKQPVNAHVMLYEKREGEDRRKRNVKTLLDTRSGRDRRADAENPGIDVKA